MPKIGDKYLWAPKNVIVTVIGPESFKGYGENCPGDLWCLIKTPEGYKFWVGKRTLEAICD